MLTPWPQNTRYAERNCTQARLRGPGAFWPQTVLQMRSQSADGISFQCLKADAAVSYPAEVVIFEILDTPKGQ